MFRILTIIMVLFLSCTKKLENPGATNTVAMSNEWWVTLRLNGTICWAEVHMPSFQPTTLHRTSLTPSGWMTGRMYGFQM